MHTVNGTACAVPRCIIALCETHQEQGGRRAIQMPKLLNVPAMEENTEQSVPSDERVPLEKIMVYKEQCKRVPIHSSKALNL